MENEIVVLVKVFVNLIDKLTSTDSSAKKLWVENEALGELYFRVGDFKRILMNLIPAGSKPRDMQVFLYSFRTLGFIICNENRFTAAKWINGKTLRVITVDKRKYLFLKEKIGKEKNEVLL